MKRDGKPPQPMGTEECAALAEPVVKKVVDMLANRDYKNLPSAAVLRGPLTPALVKGLLEGHLEGCGLRAADPYGTPMLPGQMNGSQLDIIPYRDGSGFHVGYALTSCGGKANDLTLQMSFEKDGSGRLEPYFEDLHVL